MIWEAKAPMVDRWQLKLNKLTTPANPIDSTPANTSLRFPANTLNNITANTTAAHWSSMSCKYTLMTGHKYGRLTNIWEGLMKSRNRRIRKSWNVNYSGCFALLECLVDKIIDSRAALGGIFSAQTFWYNKLSNKIVFRNSNISWSIFEINW